VRSSSTIRLLGRERLDNLVLNLSLLGVLSPEALASYLPDLHRELARLHVKEDRPSLEEIYQHLPSISLDHGILEKAENVAVVPVEMGWNDVGTWEAMHDLFPRDSGDNVIIGGVMDQEECIVFAQNRLVATIGLERLIVVDTPDATLVCHRDRSQEVKEMVTELDRQQMAEVGAAHHSGAPLGPLYGHGRGAGI
jgi:Mannose-6-phosphate isomerase